MHAPILPGWTRLRPRHVQFHTSYCGKMTDRDAYNYLTHQCITVPVCVWVNQFKIKPFFITS